MSETQRNFCEHCGGSVSPTARFCRTCGARLGSEPAEVPAAATTKPAPSGLRRFWRIALPVWIVLALGAFAASFAYGWAREPTTLPLPSPDQQATIDELGLPLGFVLTDGPGTPGEDDDVRVEEWLYPSADLIVTFVDGARTQEIGITFSEPLAQTGVSPVDLDRAMTPNDVESLLGEEGTPLDADNAGYPDYEAFAYPSARLAVGYSAGRLLTAQTY